jgi:hypothetical protein
MQKMAIASVRPQLSIQVRLIAGESFGFRSLIKCVDSLLPIPIVVNMPMHRVKNTQKQYQ